MTKPGWPDPSANPFALFGTPGGTGAAAQPLAQGLAGGMDLFKKFWSNLPGGTAVPGFLVPTLDVEELDKRLSDLRAAQQWLEVNLNVLRGTIQGLEVQRNTIAAIQSLSAMRASAPAPVPAGGGLPAGWPMPPAAATPPVPSDAGEPVAVPAPTGKAADTASDDKEEGASDRDGSKGAASEAPPGPTALAGLAASNWLGFMQDQFAKVAQAALTPPTSDVGGASSTPTTTARKAPRKAAAKKSTKQAAGRKSTARRPA